MKTRVVAFGNCQAAQIKKLLSILTPADEFSFQYFSNNDRTGGKKSASEILDGVKSADLLIYQPLSRAHGELSDENIKATVSKSCVALSFSYIFNSGIGSLCHAPKANKLFGEEYVIDLINKKYGRKEILEAYKEGSINFNVQERFQNCLSEQRRRENETSIKLADYIAENYQKQRLFISHNHPANVLFYEVIRQIKHITGMPINTNFEEFNFPRLPKQNCPISPYDVASHGYQFGQDPKWLKKGNILIEKILSAHGVNE